MYKFLIITISFVIISHLCTSAVADNAWNISSDIISELETELTNAGFVFCDPTSQPPIDEDVGLYLISRTVTTLTRVYMNESSNLINSTSQTVFMFHGWTSNITYFEVNAANVWLQFQDYNIILVDWKRLASCNYVQTAEQSVPEVANYLITYINYIKDNLSVLLPDVILLGHSAGAQVAGQIGYGLNGAIGKIYGLDPAGPLFTLPPTPDALHLDSTDAQYVECLHTNCAFEGTAVNCGLVDVYANGGSIQPGCTIDSSLGFMSCSHNRAPAIFTAAINPANQFKVTKCCTASCQVELSSITTALSGVSLIDSILSDQLVTDLNINANALCNLFGSTAFMNFDTPIPQGIYILSTTGVSPYAEN